MVHVSLDPVQGDRVTPVILKPRRLTISHDPPEEHRPGHAPGSGYFDFFAGAGVTAEDADKKGMSTPRVFAE